MQQPQLWSIRIDFSERPSEDARLKLDAVMEEKWRVVRLNKTHLRRPEVIVAKVRTALLASGWHLDIR